VELCSVLSNQILLTFQKNSNGRLKPPRKPQDSWRWPVTACNHREAVITKEAIRQVAIKKGEAVQEEVATKGEVAIKEVARGENHGHGGSFTLLA
jgi:hypothetical protein